MVCRHGGQIPLAITAPTQKAGFRVPKTVLWLIKHSFSASTFVVKIATFAKPETEIPTWILKEKLKEHVKAMEKEQIIDAFDEGKSDGYKTAREWDEMVIFLDAEQYYNQTYGGGEE